MRWNFPIVVLIALCSVSANATEVWSDRFAIEEMRIRGEGLVIEPYGQAASECNGNKFRVFVGRAGQTASSISSISRAITNAEEATLFMAAMAEAAGDEDLILDMDYYRIQYNDRDPGCYVRVIEEETVFSVWSVR